MITLDIFIALFRQGIRINKKAYIWSSHYQLILCKKNKKKTMPGMYRARVN